MSARRGDGDVDRDDDRLIDRLVDGELPEPGRRALLARLDAAPDGWRRCALAFLEAQCWREALGPVAAPAGAVARAAGRAVGPPPAPARLRWLAATAAGMLAAFALGWSVRGGDPAGSPPAPLARPGNPPAAPGAVVIAAAGASEGPPAAPAPPGPAPEPRPFTESVVRAWESRGYRVERGARLVSMELPDGRRLAVPVDEVRLRFVGDRTY
jgi:hypothetical protein